MGRYAILKREFSFLAEQYEFEIDLKQKHGAYYYIIWKNPNKKIMVLYDDREKVPIRIRVFDADSFSFDAIEYKNEFDQKSGSPRERIHRAAEWLSNAIAEKKIII